MALFTYKSQTGLKQRVAHELRSMIARSYRPGDILPKYVDLAAMLGVSLVSLKSGMDILSAQGIVTATQKRGTIVNRILKPGERKPSRVGMVIEGPVSSLFNNEHLGSIAGPIFAQINGWDADARVFSSEEHHRPLSPKVLREAGVDGIVCLGLYDNSLIRGLAELELPMVVLDHVCRDLPMDYVVCDNPRAAMAAVQHLSSLGHTRIAYLGRSAAIMRREWDPAERRAQFLDAVRKMGLEKSSTVLPFPARQTASHDKAMTASVQRLKPHRSGPTAVVCDDEFTAQRLMKCLAEARIGVPDNMSVVAMASGRVGVGNPTITSYLMDFSSMGVQGGRLLAQRFLTPRPAQSEIHRIDFRFINGNTTAILDLRR